MNSDWRPATGHGLPGTIGEIADIMIAAEKVHDDIGWESMPPVLVRVCRTVDGPFVATPRSRYDLAVVQLHDPAVLELYADNLEVMLSTTSPDDRVCCDRPPVAHFVMSEAQVIRAVHVGERILNKAPTGVEMRTVMTLVDQDDLLFLRRIRGEEPRVRLYRAAADAPDDRWDGMLYRNLWRVHTASRRLHGLPTE